MNPVVEMNHYAPNIFVTSNITTLKSIDMMINSIVLEPAPLALSCDVWLRDVGSRSFRSRIISFVREHPEEKLAAKWIQQSRDRDQNEKLQNK